ncbi:MAG: CBS domain-containing protein [Bdellovibrionales bacterium]|nr:CBS domain-containing protein [Massilia sp.]
MTRDVTSIAPDADLQRAAQLMCDMDVGVLPVCEGKQLLGIITDRDITIRATARGVLPADGRVSEVMSQGASWCFEDQRVGAVLQQMGDQQIRRMPVVTQKMQLVGMVSLGDLAIRQNSPVEGTLEDVSKPAPE